MHCCTFLDGLDWYRILELSPLQDLTPTFTNAAKDHTANLQTVIFGDTENLSVELYYFDSLDSKQFLCQEQMT